MERPRLPFAENSPNEPGESLMLEGSEAVPGTRVSTLVKSRPFTGNSDTCSPCRVPPCAFPVVLMRPAPALTSTLSVSPPALSLMFTRRVEPASTWTPFTVWGWKPASSPCTSYSPGGNSGNA